MICRRDTREDEFSIVTAGAIGFRSGSDEVVLEVGGYISKLRGELHTMWNAGQDEARMIEVITPSGFEHFFRALAEVLESGPPDPKSLDSLCWLLRFVLRPDVGSGADGEVRAQFSIRLSDAWPVLLSIPVVLSSCSRCGSGRRRRRRMCTSTRTLASAA